MIKNSFSFLGLFFVGFLNLIWCQEKEEDVLVTQQVTVIKSYNPSLSDVFQIKTTPEIPDSIGVEKQKVSYSILSIPVVETFEPNKASPLELIRTMPEKPYNSILGLGYGTKGQMFLDFSTSITLDREQQVGLMVYHDGFRGNIKNTLVNSNQSHLFLGLQHALKNNNFRGDSNLVYKRSGFNYFGFYDYAWDPLIISSITPAINRNYITLNSQWQWYDGVLREIDFRTDLTSDNFSSSEQKINIIAKTGIPVFDGEFALAAELGGVASSFKEEYFTKMPLSYQVGKAGLEIIWKQVENDLKIRIGGGAAYVVSDSLKGKSLQYFPRIELSYQPKNNKVFPFLEANGATKLASYSSLSTQNPFLFPGINLQPMWKKYNARIGARSSQANVLSFDFSLGYDELENMPLFKRLPYDPFHKNAPSRFSNAFEIQYANVIQYDFRAQLGFDFARENHLGFEMQYFTYSTENQEILWNIPQLKLNANAHFNWSKLSFSFNAEMIGERNAALWPIFNTLTLDPNRKSETEQLPFFLQSTFFLNYKIKNPFDLFLKGRLSNSQSHGQWGYYPEPNYLFLAGLSYKFNQ